MRSTRHATAGMILGFCLLAAMVPRPGRAEDRPPRLSPVEAAARALNRFEVTADGYRLEHPLHRVTFSDDGITVQPRRGPRWQWQMNPASSLCDQGMVCTPVRPQACSSDRICYSRGAVLEQYLARRHTVEQQFVIPQPPSLGGEDLVIAGTVICNGTFESGTAGWQWRSADGIVRLGDVTVLDATGRRLPATMSVTAEHTRIVVDASALADARYPVIIDPEIGTNDTRLSDMGMDGDSSFDADEPAVAYNSMNNEYLVVWHGDDDSGALVDGEREIFGQRIDAATGAEVGQNDFRISDVGPNGDPDYEALRPAVAYNSVNNEYLVVWTSSDDSLESLETEIFGQRLSATGQQVGTNDFRISDMGPDGDLDFGADSPAVVFNAMQNEYLVVWDGTDSLAGESEIFGQRLSSTGQALGTNDFRISNTGAAGDASFDALDPAVAYNSTTNEYLVAWSGDDDTAPLVEDEFEIFGQLLSSTGALLGGAFRISDMGTNGETTASANDPAVAYNSTNNEYLVVWSGDDGSAPLADDEREIFSQRLDAGGTEIGNNDLRISDIGMDGDPNFDALRPGVAYNADAEEYLVVFSGDALAAGEREIFGQRLHAASGVELGINDFRISDLGTADGDGRFDAMRPAVVYNTDDKEFLVVWSGDDDTAPLVDSEEEIFAQAYSSHSTIAITEHTPDPSGAGQAVTVSYTVTGIVAGPTGNVTVSDGTDSCIGTVESGSCTIALSTTGARDLIATYEGNNNFSASTSETVRHTVTAGNQPPPTTGGCGAGAALMLPLSLAGAWVLRRRRRN